MHYSQDTRIYPECDVPLIHCKLQNKGLHIHVKVLMTKEVLNLILDLNLVLKITH